MTGTYAAAYVRGLQDPVPGGYTPVSPDNGQLRVRVRRVSVAAAALRVEHSLTWSTPLPWRQLCRTVRPCLTARHCPAAQVSACCKHFAAHNVEGNEWPPHVQFDAVITPQDLLDTYLPAFRRDARCSLPDRFALVRYVPMCEDAHVALRARAQAVRGRGPRGLRHVRVQQIERSPDVRQQGVPPWRVGGGRARAATPDWSD